MRYKLNAMNKKEMNKKQEWICYKGHKLYTHKSLRYSQYY